MISLSNADNYSHFTLEKKFIEVLFDRMKLGLTGLSAKSRKNIKKKLKKKQKQT